MNEQNKLEQILREIWEKILMREWRWSPILIKVKLEFDENIPVACFLFDKLTIKINPFVFEDLEYHEKMTVIYHEILHFIFDHQHRRKERDLKRWNIAGDLEINSLLQQHLMRLPDFSLLPKIFNLPPNQLAEWYYEKITLDTKSTTCFEGEIPEELEAEIEKVKEEIQKEPGDGTLEKIVKMQITSIKKKKNLERTLQTFFNKPTYTYDWKRKSNRIIADERAFLPKLILKNEKIEAIIALDASASVSDEDFEMFISVLRSTLKNLKFKLEIIQFDTEIKECKTITKVDEIDKIERLLSGGTSFDKVIDYANKQKKDIIILTDGEDELTVKPNVKTLWVLSKENPELKPQVVI